MAILNQTTVGDIIYYTIDSAPTHTAPKGSVAIVTISPTIGVMYRNNDGGSTWIRLMEDDVYAHAQFTDNATGRDTAAGTWTNLDALGWVLENSKGFSHPVAGQITYTGDTTVTLFTKLAATVEADAKWQDYELVNALNNTVGAMYQGATGKATSKRCTIANTDVKVDFVTNDYLNVGLRWTVKEGGGAASSRTYIPRHCSYAIEKIDEETPVLSSELFSEDWESSGFTENSWTVVNDANNLWIVGQNGVDVISGTSSAYVSNDGSTATYLKTLSDVSHFYMDFVFPSSYDNIEMTFDWVCWGEDAAAATSYDYGAVCIVATGTTPTAASEVITTQATAGGNGRLGASANLGKFNEGYGGSDNTVRSETIDLTLYAGETKRLVFTWKDDTSAGDDKPWIVDNIKINGLSSL